MNKNIVLSSVILILTGIILGAFGAHALKDLVSTEQVSSFETGVRYQLIHGLALLAIGLNADRFNFSLNVFHRMIIVGVVFFSVSIYLLALQAQIGDLNFLGPVTPIGGTVLIVAWSLLLIKIINSSK